MVEERRAPHGRQARSRHPVQGRGQIEGGRPHSTSQPSRGAVRAPRLIEPQQRGRWACHPAHSVHRAGAQGWRRAGLCMYLTLAWEPDTTHQMVKVSERRGAQCTTHLRAQDPKGTRRLRRSPAVAHSSESCRSKSDGRMYRPAAHPLSSSTLETCRTALFCAAAAARSRGNTARLTAPW
eukprot:scaffold7079_cov128-Isochrysis_galbana.AAC.5